MLSKNPVKCLQRGIVEISGNFTVDGSGGVDVTTGQGFSVAHTTGGTYTITFDDAFQSFVCGNANVQFETVATTNFDLVAQFGLYSASAKTLVIRIWDYSAAALADPSDNDSVHFSVKMSWTTV
jgi:hypothetical protein